MTNLTQFTPFSRQFTSFSPQFTPFSRLPPELRNKIWFHVANNEPRTLDIWTDFRRCEISNTIFYTQAYECALSLRPPPPIFRVNTESRNEALKHYVLEFATKMSLPIGISVSIRPKIYINYETDILIPRGYWNMISFSDLVARAGDKLTNLAIDVNGSFWKDNLRDYCKKGCWVFGGLEELILYDSRWVDMFKESDFLDKFKERYTDGPKDLSFSDLFGEPSERMSDVKVFLEKTFDRIEGKMEEVRVVGEDGQVVEPVVETQPSYLKDCKPTLADGLQRPVLWLADLEVTEPAAVPI